MTCDELISRLVHELRTPLGSLRLLGEQLAEGEQLAHGGPDQRSVALARNVARIVDDLGELVDELGELGRSRSGRLEHREQTVDVDELVMWTEQRLAGLASQRGLATAASLEPGAPRRIRSDGERARRILDLLSSSAVAATREGEIRARFGAAAGDAGLEVVIVDGGAPVEPGDQESVFDELHPHPRNRRRHGGTKLTLALARELARSLGGEVRIESAAGRTSTILMVPDRAPRRDP